MIKKMRTFKIPITFVMKGVLEVEAENLEEAKEFAVSENTPLPEKKEYIFGSCELDKNEELVMELNPNT